MIEIRRPAKSTEDQRSPIISPRRMPVWKRQATCVFPDFGNREFPTNEQGLTVIGIDLGRRRTAAEII
jgi:hypothetical protein